jgi:hypothetical protein
MLTQITVDVICSTTQHGDPVYRVYVDSDLLTERTWIWPAYEIYIRENLEVDIEPGIHEVRIESCGAETSFITQNLCVNGKPVTGNTNLTFEISA